MRWKGILKTFFSQTILRKLLKKPKISVLNFENIQLMANTGISENLENNTLTKEFILIKYCKMIAK